SLQPPTCVDRKTRCAAKSTGPPKPTPQQSSGSSRRQPAAIWTIWASIQSRPPSRFVGLDARRIMPLLSKTAIENLAPPISMVSVFIGQQLVGRGSSGALFHDRDRGDQVAEPRRLEWRAGRGERRRGARAKAVARAADIDGLTYVPCRR